MKNKFYAAVATGLLLLTTNGAAQALTMTDVGTVDFLKAWTILANSGDTSELEWVNKSIFGNDYLTSGVSYYTTMTKINTNALPEPAWVPVDDGDLTTNLYAYDLQSTPPPAYFFIKVSNQGHYLYQNLANFNWGVVDLNMGDLVDISVVGKISHTGEVGTAPVPEPATMLLLGTGLVGIAGICRRKKD